MACSWAHCRSVPYGSLCAHTAFPQRAEVEGKEECMCVGVSDFVCVCVAAASSKMPTLIHHSPYLFMGSLLSPVVAQGDHLQSHLHNDNNKVAWSGCECVCVQTHVFMCILAPSNDSLHSSVHPCLLSSPPLVPSNMYPVTPSPPTLCPPTPPLTPLRPVPAPSCLHRPSTHTHTLA